MNVRFFDPGKSYKAIKPKVDAEMQRVLAAGKLILQEDVEKFEDKLANYVGTKYAIAMNSGTDALFLSLLAYGINEKDTVLAPSYTFRATVDSAVRTGAKVVLYDLGRPEFGDATVWIPAHIAGEVPEWMEEAVVEARKRNILIIEDFAQAIGADKVRGDTACYSFYPAKILGCYGDGGAVCTDSAHIADWLKRARNHFKGETGPVGLNSRLDNLQAAVLNVKMPLLPHFIKRRKEIAEMYDAGLKGVGLDKKREVYQDYIITYEDRDGLYDFLKEEGVETMKNGYPFADQFTKMPRTQAYEAISLRLPCNPDLEDDEVAYVIEKVNEYAGRL